MTATYIKSMGTYRIILDRREAETVAYSGTKYSDLLTALDVFKDAETLTMYGSKFDVQRALTK